MKILHVVGARPNFMKAAPVFKALGKYREVRQNLVHTGQHYDFNMSDVFFQQLGLPAPDINLSVGSETHAKQTSEIIDRFESVVLTLKPDIVLVYGDVNSTVGAALVCAKLLVPVAHIEAGLRSFDRTMPEEINRLLTDQISDLLFTPSEDGNRNLKREGIAEEKVHLVGNVMIDTIVRMLPKAMEQMPKELPERYVLVTLHRPSNVDDLDWLKLLLKLLDEMGREIPILFPVHPRTRERIKNTGMETRPCNPGLSLLPPTPYLEFLALQSRATVVITDSGGVQEETTFLGVPCLTLRENTERPITVSMGTNILVGRDHARLRDELERVLAGQVKRGTVPHLWDGHAAERIAQVIMGPHPEFSEVAFGELQATQRSTRNSS
ncbi:MAG TPA: UDP-N-acetylglucosamine 2-epimerase (non-hydrolyzing) [Acidobacteriaceae bacterium]|nr:UDP-N-acetylglucosamine 2-epimerase (non-hydrolyzing) [Acidobacteriaceae bacterium]